MGKMEKAPSPDIPFDYSLSRLEKEFLKTGDSQGWTQTNAPILLAVSGGSDSMAMLWLFSMFRGRNLIVAHLDHGIRGEEGKSDASFVASMAARFGVRHICQSIPVPALLQKGESLEDGARRIRYRFLEETAKAEGAWGIGVAHTSDDSAETFLHNLLRGSGVRGLSGIPEKRGLIFRPLLKYSREFLRELLRLYGIPWREDSTNEDTSYLRNKIRNVLIPLVEREINSSARKHILGTAGDLAFFRRQEEKIQGSLLRLASVSLPFCSYACSLPFLRRLDGDTTALFLRGAGRTLGLKTLSRERTEKLAELLRKDNPWCFQWQSSMYVFSSFPFVTWVDPVILNRVDPPGISVPMEGIQGTFEWNNWQFSWKREKSADASAGWMQAVFPCTGDIKIFSLSELEKHRDIWAPQWGRHIFPVLRSGSFEWVPFWGKRTAPGVARSGNEVVRIQAKIIPFTTEKGKDDGLQGFGYSDSER
ncbi:tRNA lysidine(34) synthetase TilS [Aminivibrio sp.]|uniref:tRNA lysidine(34) synthetase TilS n=1 Tax=Aminivibrio sp. TaxID=1872489 RepID=UPI001A3ED97D|nr:tRNA lysidine(34) synthetase TilS [Aminivibrio sp.]MBL3538622.1 tRNA lysidine(34) synthetase TilS [Aminivibrio sp.]